MQSYINYLLEDIEAAKRPETPFETAPAIDDEDSMEAHFAEVERWLESDPQHTFGHHCGLKTEQFPPSEKLTEQQMQQVIKVFSQLMYSWNMDADIPEEVPTERRYQLLVNIVDTKVEVINSGMLTIDYCTGNSDGCELGEYCPCKNLIFGPEYDMENFNPDKSELPF